MRSIVLVLASMSVTYAGCGSDGDRAEQGRGSEACRVWQDAVCDHFADTCDALERDECDRQFQAVTCRSDSIAKSCTEKLEDADCGEASNDCLIEGVANAEPAIAACERLVEKFCELSTICVATNMDTCVDRAAKQLECENAVGYRLAFESCLQAVEAMECTDKLSLPLACRDVIIVGSTLRQ